MEAVVHHFSHLFCIFVNLVINLQLAYFSLVFQFAIYISVKQFWVIFTFMHYIFLVISSFLSLNLDNHSFYIHSSSKECLLFLLHLFHVFSFSILANSHVLLNISLFLGLFIYFFDTCFLILSLYFSSRILHLSSVFCPVKDSPFRLFKVSPQLCKFCFTVILSFFFISLSPCLLRSSLQLEFN